MLLVNWLRLIGLALSFLGDRYRAIVVGLVVNAKRQIRHPVYLSLLRRALLKLKSKENQRIRHTVKSKFETIDLYSGSFIIRFIA